MAIIFSVVLFGCAGPEATDGTPSAEAASTDAANSDVPPSHASRPKSARIATFNTALSRPTQGELLAAMQSGRDRKVRQVAEILQRVRPDVVLLNEVDYDGSGALVEAFQENYLGVSQNGADPITYRFSYTPEVNAGEPSGTDLDRNGTVGGAGDAHGWGNYPGHYGMVLLSRFPIREEHVRTFRNLRWVDLPGHAMPVDWYNARARARLRLSSKTHAEVPVRLPDGRTIGLMIAHPTPPVFDGDEDRNGKRNHDEVRFWVDRLDGKVFTDDAGTSSRFPADIGFVVLGDLNADPHDGDSFGDAIRRLIHHPRVHQGVTPASRGAVTAAETQGGLNASHGGNPAHDTGDFSDEPPRGPGNLRIDYALPSANLEVTSAGVFWPAPDQPHADLVDVSDHRLVWVDIQLDPKQ